MKIRLSFTDQNRHSLLVFQICLIW